MSLGKTIILIFLGSIAVYCVGRIFAKGILDQIESRLNDRLNKYKFKKEENDNKENDK